MSNQNESPNNAELNGCTLLPIELMWKHFLDNHTTDLKPDQEHNAKMIYYIACKSMYNMLIGSLRADHTLALLAVVTEDIRKDIDNYFDEKPQPITHVDSNIR